MSILSLIRDRVWLRYYPNGALADIEIPSEPYTKAIEEASDTYQDNVALIFLGEKFRYRSLKRNFYKFASALAELGVSKGERVAIYLPNLPQFIIAYLGVLKAGATSVAINPLYTSSEIAHIIRDSGAETIVCLDVNYRNVAEVRDKTNLRNIIVTNITDFLPIHKRLLGKALRKIPSGKYSHDPKIHSLRGLIDRAPEHPPNVTIDPEVDLACLQYTGGTTGFPKGVMLTHHNIVSNRVTAYSMISPFLQTGREVLIALLPFFHIYGQVVVMGGGLAYGNTLLVFPRLNLDALLYGIQRHKATVFYGIPSLYNSILNHDTFREYNLTSIKHWVCGADVLPLEVAKKWEHATGKQIIQGYGLSETSPVTHLNPFDKNKVGSFGVPIPNTYAGLVEIDGTTFVPPGDSVGEVVIKGPQVMKGYWNKPEENAKVFVNIDGENWLRTGDLAKMDGEGYFYFVDRIKDMMKYKGYLIAAAEVESVLYDHPAVKEVAVIGVPDPAVGERMKAYVVLREDARGITHHDLVRWCREKLAPYKVPEFIEFRDMLPKSPVGKILRRELRAEVTRRIDLK